MTPKEFLCQARDIDRRIDRAQERIERLRSRIESGRMSRLTGMPRGGGGDWTDTEARLLELESRYGDEIRRFCRIKIQAVDAIRNVGNSTYEEILTLRYLDGLTWEAIAEAMGYDARYIQKLHGKALQRVTVPAEYSQPAQP